VPEASSRGGFSELQGYAHILSTAFPGPNATEKSPSESVRGEMEREREREEDGVLTGCREAVELLTRNPRKGMCEFHGIQQLSSPESFETFEASYDVNKDGVKVAVLTFTKSAYRLGETALGVVELNEPTSRARVLQVSTLNRNAVRILKSICQRCLHYLNLRNLCPHQYLRRRILARCGVYTPNTILRSFYPTSAQHFHWTYHLMQAQLSK